MQHARTRGTAKSRRQQDISGVGFAKKTRVHSLWFLTGRVAQGFVLGDEANAFFTADEILDQVQDSESSSQRGGFDRSARRFAAVEFVGVSTIGGPTA